MTSRAQPERIFRKLPDAAELAGVGMATVALERFAFHAPQAFIATTRA